MHSRVIDGPDGASAHVGGRGKGEEYGSDDTADRSDAVRSVLLERQKTQRGQWAEGAREKKYEAAGGRTEEMWNVLALRDCLNEDARCSDAMIYSIHTDICETTETKLQV
jgi:hypothetical protein